MLFRLNGSGKFPKPFFYIPIIYSQEAAQGASLIIFFYGSSVIELIDPFVLKSVVKASAAVAVRSLFNIVMTGTEL
jgi:hypothetical protein